MKLNIFRILLIICVSAFFIGCSSTGNQLLKEETSETIAEKMKEGVTTKQEVVDYLGAPMETSFTDGGLEILTYEYTRFTPKARNFIPYNFFSLGQDGKRKELVILFDENGIIKKAVMNESEVENRSGLFE